MDSGRYWLRYNIYHLGLDLDSIADVCFKLGGQLIKLVYMKILQKIWDKFNIITYFILFILFNF